MKDSIIEQIGKNLTPYLLPGHNNYVTDIIFSPNGDKFASGSFHDKDEDFNNLLIWDSKTHKLITKIIVNVDDIYSMTFSPDGKQIITTCRLGPYSLALWDTQTGYLLHNFVERDCSIFSAYFSSDGKRIISIGLNHDDSYITVWNSKTGEEIFNFGPKGKETCSPKIEMSHDRTKVVFYYQDRIPPSASVWDVNTGIMLHELEFDGINITMLKFSPDDKKLITLIDESVDNIIIWNVLSGEKVITLQGHTEKITSLTFSLDGRYIATTIYENYSILVLWDVVSGKKLFNLIGHYDRIKSVLFTSDSRYILSCSLDEENNIIIWETLSGKKLFNLTGHTFVPSMINLSPNNNTVVAGKWCDKKDSFAVWNIPFNLFVIIKNDLTKEQVELLYDYCYKYSNNLEFYIDANDPIYKIYQTMPDSIKQIMDQRKDTFLDRLKNYFIEIYNFLKINSLFVQKLKFKRQCNRFKISVITFTREIRKNKIVTSIWPRKRNYGFLKLTWSNRVKDYSYQDASSIEMCILHYFLVCDIRSSLSSWRELILDDTITGGGGNLTSVDKEEGLLIITDTYSEEEVPTELEMTYDEFLKLLDDWEEKVIKLKPKEVIIKYENDEFIIETKN